MLRERSAKPFHFFSIGLLVMLAANSITRGEIVRWDNRQPVPGMEGVVPSPEVNLVDRQLEFANLSFMNLSGANFRRANLANADFILANLTGAHFESSTLNHAQFGGALVTGAAFHQTTSRGFTSRQLYSTASYHQKNLQGIGLSSNNLSGWDFRGQDLTNARLESSVLTNANLAGANLTYASFLRSALNHANFTGTNLKNANFNSATLTDARFSAADLRGATDMDLTAVIGSSSAPLMRNTILPGGTIAGLVLDRGDELVVRDDNGVVNPTSVTRLVPRPPIAVTVNDHFLMSDAGVLQLVIGSDPWNSLISFEGGIPVALGGTLKLQFTDDTNLHTQVGRTLRIFNWAGVSPSGTLRVESPYVWDLSRLYTSGEVTLQAIPEPTTAMLLLLALFPLTRIPRL
jgi:uncharacterized protein YjbI with pentapeptide repeats